jgi:parallel beta-helix repeat protein
MEGLKIATRMFHNALFFLILTEMLAASCSTCLVRGDTRRITVPDDFALIQKAIDDATNGDMIFVRRGYYFENVLVNKEISLIGESRDTTIIVEASKTGNVLTIAADNTTISGFTILGGDSGIYVNGISGAKITGNRITKTFGRGVGDGIYMFNSSETIVSQNIITENIEDGITLAPNSTCNTIIQNQIKGNGGMGVYMHDGANRNLITSNDINFNLDGIYMANVYDNQIVANNISNNTEGQILLCASSSNNTFYHNNFATSSVTSKPLNNSWNSLGNEAWGNYWSTYKGVDENGDGIGEAPYEASNETNCYLTDFYPLISPWTSVRVFYYNYEQIPYPVYVASNSTTINDFSFDRANRMIVFTATSLKGYSTFCNVTIHRNLLDALPKEWKTNVNSQPIHQDIMQNENDTYLYFFFVGSNNTAVQIQGTNSIGDTAPIWSELWFWSTIFSTVCVFGSILFGVRYYGNSRKQRRIIDLYKRDLPGSISNHRDRARLLIKLDVTDRQSKIDKFMEKHGVRIRPAISLEELDDKLGFHKKNEDRR